jgi:hypothetical protein
VSSREAGELHIVPGGVFGGEPAGEDILARVVVVKARLNTGDIIGRAFKGEDCFFKLVGLGLIFGIVDNEILTAGEFEADIAGFGFGTGVRWGDEGDPYPRGEVHGLSGGDGEVVVCLKEELDIFRLLGVVERFKGFDHLREGFGLFIHRDDYGVDGPLAWFLSGDFGGGEVVPGVGLG